MGLQVRLWGRGCFAILGIVFLVSGAFAHSEWQTEIGVTPAVVSLEMEPGEELRTVVYAYSFLPMFTDIQVELTDLEPFPTLPFPTPLGYQPTCSCLDWITLDRTKLGRLHRRDALHWLPIPLTIQVPADATGLSHAVLIVKGVSAYSQSGTEMEVELVVPIFVYRKDSLLAVRFETKDADYDSNFVDTSMQFVLPQSLRLDQCFEAMDPYHTFAGSAQVDISSTLPARLQVSRTAISKVGGDWTTRGAPHEVFGRSRFELEVTGSNVCVEKLTAQPKPKVANITLRLLPKFRIEIASPRPLNEKIGDQRSNEPLNAFFRRVDSNHEGIKKQIALLKQLRSECRSYHQQILAMDRHLELKAWLINRDWRKEGDLKQIRRNSRQVAEDLQRLRTIEACFANALNWHGWRSHSPVKKSNAVNIRTWLEEDVVAWGNAFLDKLEIWQARSDVKQWFQDLQQMGFSLALRDHQLVTPIPPMPSMESIPLMPALPDSALKNTVKQDPQQRERGGPAIRSIFQGDVRWVLSDLMEEAHTMILVAPQVRGWVNLDSLSESRPLELVLDMICLSTQSTWEKHGYGYYVKPCPTEIMSLPYTLQNAGSLDSSDRGPLVGSVYCGDASVVVCDLSLDADIPILANMDLAGCISLDLSRDPQPLEIALDMICLSTGTTWKRSPYFYLITACDKLPYEVPYEVLDAHSQKGKPMDRIIETCSLGHDLGMAIGEMAAATGLNIVKDPAIDPEQRLSFEIRNMPLPVMFDMVCWATDSTWKQTPYFLWLVPREGPMQLPYPILDAEDVVADASGPVINNAWEDEDLRAAFQDIAVDSPLPIVLTPDVQGSLTLEINNLSLQETLDKFCQQTGHAWKKTPYYYLVTGRGRTD